MQDQYLQYPLTFKSQNVMQKIQIECGVLFTDSNYFQEQLNGYCRIFLKSGTIIEGYFQKDSSQQVNYFGNYLRGWIKAKWSKKQGLYGDGIQYDQRGNSIYEGYFKQYSRDGKGKQYFGDDSKQGQWVNGIKNGLFKQISRNYSFIGEGYYKNDTKVGNWKYSYNGQIQQVEYSKLTSQTQQPSLNQNNVLQQVQIINQKTNLTISQDLQIKTMKNKFLQQIQKIDFSKRKSILNSKKLQYVLQKIKKWKLNIMNFMRKQNVMKQFIKLCWSKYILYLKLKRKLKRKQNQQLKSLKQFKQQQRICTITELQIGSSYTIHNHRSVLTQQCFSVILNQYAMLRNSVLSSWSIVLQYYSSYYNIDNRIFFPVQLMQHYTGKQFNKRQYENVRYYSKHLIGQFNLFRIHSKQKSSKKILIPIIRGCHFTLAVLIIQSHPLSIQCCIYDSLNSCQGYQRSASSNPTFDMVQKYLIDYSKQQTYWQQQYKQIVSLAIQNMKFRYERCPQQQDGISCGVFVCINMYYFALNKQQQIPKFIHKNKLKQFRVECLYKILKGQKINFQQIKKIENIFKQN